MVIQKIAITVLLSFPLVIAGARVNADLKKETATERTGNIIADLIVMVCTYIIFYLAGVFTLI